MSPISLHRYLYAADNPIRYVDPTGQFAAAAALSFARIAFASTVFAGIAGGAFYKFALGGSFLGGVYTFGTLALALNIAYHEKQLSIVATKALGGAIAKVVIDYWVASRFNNPAPSPNQALTIFLDAFAKSAISAVFDEFLGWFISGLHFSRIPTHQMTN